jgi:PAS domain S-box-containing protein
VGIDVLEARRLAALSRCLVMASHDPHLDNLVAEAARATSCPQAMLVFIDAERVWPRASHGFAAPVAPRHADPAARVLDSDLVVIEDLCALPEYAAHPLVRDEPHARFYAAAAVNAGSLARGGAGLALGALVVLAPAPFTLDERAAASLRVLADAVAARLELAVLRDARLTKSESLLAAAQRIAGIGSWEWHIPTGTLSWSDHMYTILGVAAGTPPSFEAFMERIHPDEREQVAARTQQVLHEGRTSFPDYRVVWPDGTVRIVAASTELTRDHHGAPLRMTGALQDVTDMRRSEQERQELAQQMLHSQKLESLGLLSASVAHDFNNFLVGVLGNAELAALDPELSAHTRTLIEHVIGSARQASGLTRQLLAYTGRGRVAMRPLDLAEHVGSLSSLLRASLPKSVRIVTSFEPELPRVKADADQLQQVTMNLILNAADAYGGREGVVEVRTFHEELGAQRRHGLTLPGPLAPGSYVVLEVRDHGLGMDDATLGRIFEPFYTTKLSGRGLGLAAVVGIVRAHGAVLSVDSARGQGSSFRVHFATAEHPSLTPPKLPSRPPVEPPALLLRGLGALVVDDEPDVRAVVRAVLERERMHVLEAEDGEHAITTFTREGARIDVVILDRVMPGRESQSVLAELRRQRPELPVLVYSGLPDEDGGGLDELPAQPGSARGPRQAFLHKPFSPSALLAKLRDLLAARR